MEGGVYYKPTAVGRYSPAIRTRPTITGNIQYYLTAGDEEMTPKGTTPHVSQRGKIKATSQMYYPHYIGIPNKRRTRFVAAVISLLISPGAR